MAVSKRKLAEARDLLMGVDSKPDEPEKEGPAFGGGYLVGLIVNPSPEELKDAAGFDGDDFSCARSYGGCSYLPLIQYCKEKIKSKSHVERVLATSHINDRFMLKRNTTATFTEAEEAMYREAHIVGQQVLDKGAVGPIVFIKVQVIGHSGPEILKNHYIPSCGINSTADGVLASFKQFMSQPQRWVLEVL